MARTHYGKEFADAWAALESAEGLKRKWLLSHLKYLAGRLVHLAPMDEMSALVKRLETTPELAEHHAVAKAVLTGRVQGHGTGSRFSRRQLNGRDTGWANRRAER